jgi:hypothetical protein
LLFPKLTASQLLKPLPIPDSTLALLIVATSLYPFNCRRSSFLAVMDSPLPTIVEDLPISRRQFDYIIVGGGTAGCVIADRVAENLPNATILMIEGGESELGKEEILNLNGAADLWGSDMYDYSYRSVPQPYGTNTPRPQSDCRKIR